MFILDKVYQKIGIIIKNIQYIEWNLLTKLGINTFEELTLGQIINLIKKQDIFSLTNIDKLEHILKRRNDLVHNYFKIKDFEKHMKNKPFLESELKFLDKFYKEVCEFNSLLYNG